nr:MAG TPA: hypothetical protein [Bacteriophage sp.]
MESHKAVLTAVFHRNINKPAETHKKHLAYEILHHS